MVKVVVNTQKPPSKELEPLRRLCKRLEGKSNVQTRLMETATDSAEEDDPYLVGIPTFKPSTSFSKDNNFKMF